jgi:hypothetical protein
LPVAAGSQQQARQLYLSKAGTLHSLHAQSENSTITISVQEVPLDEVITDRIDFVKMDVEGAEIESIKGMTRIFQSNPDIRLLVEWNPPALRRAGHDPSELPALLWAAGFELSVVEEKKLKKSVGEMLKDLQSDSLKFSGPVNLFAKQSVSKSL